MSVVIIFDWDDTCFATTAQETNAKLEASLLAMLQACSKFVVYIVTNAVVGWVEECTKKFADKTLVDLVKTIPVFARPTIESPSGVESKYAAMTRILALNPLAKRVLCVGDSEYEDDAFKLLFKDRNAPTVWLMVRFLSEPTLDDLVEQQKQFTRVELLVYSTGQVNCAKKCYFRVVYRRRLSS